jgi:WD40 repeat protein
MFSLVGGTGGRENRAGPVAVATGKVLAAPGPAGAPAAEVPLAPPRPPEQAGELGQAGLLTGHSERIMGVAFLPDGKRALSCSYRDFIVWDLVRKTKKVFDPLQAFREGMGVGAFNPAAPPQVPAAPNLRRLSDTFGAVAVTPDGKRALLAGPDTLLIWDLEKWQEVHSFGDAGGGTIHCGVAVSRDGKRALHVDQHNVVHLYDLQKAEEVQGAGCPGHVACFFPDGRRLLVGESPDFVRQQGKLLIHDTADPTKDVSFPAHFASINCVALDADGTHALSGGGQENDVFLWDLALRKDPVRLQGHTAMVTCVAFAPDGKRALSGSQDGTVRLWDLQTHKEVEPFRKQHQQAVTCVAFSPGGGYALSGSEDKTIGFWTVPE